MQLRSVYVRRSSRRTPSTSSYSVVAVAKMLGFTQGDMHDRQRTDRSLSRRKNATTMPPRPAGWPARDRVGLWDDLATGAEMFGRSG